MDGEAWELSTEVALNGPRKVSDTSDALTHSSWPRILDDDEVGAKFQDTGLASERRHLVRVRARAAPHALSFVLLLKVLMEELNFKGEGDAVQVLTIELT